MCALFVPETSRSGDARLKPIFDADMNRNDCRTAKERDNVNRSIDFDTYIASIVECTDYYCR